MESENFIDLELPENGVRSQFGVFLKIVFLPVLVFAVFLLGFLGLINLKVELHSIVMMGILLFIALLAARHNAEFATCLFEGNIENFKSKLKNYIMSHLLVVADQKRSNAEFDAFIDDYSQNIRNDNYASVMAGIFPMLGILGTFISIAISMPNFSSTDINALENEIAQLLGGVGTAFYVSIYGIFLAIWWIYFEKKGISRFEKLIAKYKFATRGFFWTRDEITQGLLQNIAAKNETMARVIETSFTGDFNRKISEAAKEKFDNFNHMLTLEKEALKESATQLEKIQEITARTTKVYQNMNLNYDKILTSISKLASDIVSIQNSLAMQYKELLDASESRRENLDKSLNVFTGELSKFSATLQTAVENLQNIKNNSLKPRSFEDEDILEALKKTLTITKEE